MFLAAFSPLPYFFPIVRRYSRTSGEMRTGGKTCRPVKSWRQESSFAKHDRMGSGRSGSLCELVLSRIGGFRVRYSGSHVIPIRTFMSRRVN
jgi:hypothetical protein